MGFLPQKKTKKRTQTQKQNKLNEHRGKQKNKKTFYKAFKKLQLPCKAL